MYLKVEKSCRIEEVMLGLIESKDREIETYTMINRSQENNDSLSINHKKERILCVKRIDLMFDNAHCQAISFIDISPYAWLRQQEE